MIEMIYEPSMNDKYVVLDKGKIGDFEYVIISRGTHPNAYVGVDRESILYRKRNYWTDNITCHGGVTYSSINHRSGTVNPFIKEIDYKSYVIGWDYAHLGDYMGFYEILHKDKDIKYFSEMKKWTTKEILKEVENVIEQLKGIENEYYGQ